MKTTLMMRMKEQRDTRKVKTPEMPSMIFSKLISKNLGSLEMY